MAGRRRIPVETRLAPDDPIVSNQFRPRGNDYAATAVIALFVALVSISLFFAWRAVLLVV